MSTITPGSVADAHAHRLYAEYAGMPVGVVTQCVQHTAALQLELWNVCAGDTFAERARAYHEHHEEAVFALLQRTANRAQRRAEHEQSGFASWLEASGDEVLDFGGGLGFSASLLRDAGKQVTYVDVDGAVTAFARWYFERCGQDDIEVLTTPVAGVELPADRQWDLVLAENVLEWLPDAAAAAERLAAAVRPGGTLFVQLDAAAAPAPMANAVAIDDLLARCPALRQLQHVLRGDDGRHAFRAG